MKNIILLVFPLFLPIVSFSAPISISSNVKIEPVTSFTIFELWNATTPTSAEFGLVNVNYRMLDVETPIVQGGWVNCGLVMVGTGDVAIRPVAFRLWTKKACKLSVKNSKEWDSQQNIEFDLFVNPEVSLRFQVSAELDVKVSGKNIGRIRSGLEKR
jgi:hypothetical protein